jgi:peptidoglycan-associated lipoprotein
MSPFSVRRAAVAPATALGLVALAAGCHHKAPPAPAPEPVAAAPAPQQQPAAAPTPVTPVADDGSARRASEEARNTLMQMAFFDFDKSDLTDQDRSTLDAKIPILQSNPTLRIRIDGNCDDRGSDEYNMALGQRRAAMAKRYLTDHGVDASRIDIISYGKERPIAQGSDESAWARNRNDQFEIVAGPEELRAGE